MLVSQRESSTHRRWCGFIPPEESWNFRLVHRTTLVLSIIYQYITWPFTLFLQNMYCRQFYTNRLMGLIYMYIRTIYSTIKFCIFVYTLPWGIQLCLIVKCGVVQDTNSADFCIFRTLQPTSSLRDVMVFDRLLKVNGTGGTAPQLARMMRLEAFWTDGGFPKSG